MNSRRGPYIRSSDNGACSRCSATATRRDEKVIGPILNASDPDLKAFQARGGKLIQYHGWNDGSPPPLYSVNYCISVLAKMGGVEKTQNFCGLFMAPE